MVLKNNKFESSMLWESFIKSLERVYKNKYVKESYLSQKARTANHEINIHQVFDELKNEIVLENGCLIPAKECLNRVDHALFFRDNNGWEVPIILIEVENNDDSDSNMRELDKLCYLSAPLKIIILHTRIEYANKEILDDWDYMLKVYLENTFINGIIGLIVLDNFQDEHFVYYSKIIENNQKTYPDKIEDWNKFKLNIDINIS